jgi:hypothetical protein
MKEIEDFIKKLKEERADLSRKLSFFLEHKFAKEAEFVQTKIQIISTILNELESVAGGHKKGIDVKFSWVS